MWFQMTSPIWVCPACNWQSEKENDEHIHNIPVYGIIKPLQYIPLQSVQELKDKNKNLMSAIHDIDEIRDSQEKKIKEMREALKKIIKMKSMKINNSVSLAMIEIAKEALSKYEKVVGE